MSEIALHLCTTDIFLNLIKIVNLLMFCDSSGNSLLLWVSRNCLDRRWRWDSGSHQSGYWFNAKRFHRLKGKALHLTTLWKPQRRTTSGSRSTFDLSVALLPLQARNAGYRQPITSNEWLGPNQLGQPTSDKGVAWLLHEERCEKLDLQGHSPQGPFHLPEPIIPFTPLGCQSKQQPRLPQAPFTHTLLL